MTLKQLETDLEIFLVEQDFDAMMKRAPVGVLCIFGVQYIMGRLSSSSKVSIPSRSVYSILSQMTSD